MVRAPEHKKPLLVLRSGVVTETAANTATSGTIATPVSAAAFIAMRIHRIEFELAFPDTVAATRTATTVDLLTRDASSGLPNIDDPSVIARAIIVADNATSAGGTIENQHLPCVKDFGEQGILSLDAQFVLRVLGTANTAAKTARVAIYYTLETLEQSEWLAALSSAGLVLS